MDGLEDDFVFVEECPSNRVISLSSSVMSDSTSFPETDDEDEASQSSPAGEEEACYKGLTTGGGDDNGATVHLSHLHTHTNHAAGALFSRQEWASLRTEEMANRDKVEELKKAAKKALASKSLSTYYASLKVLKEKNLSLNRSKAIDLASSYYEPSEHQTISSTSLRLRPDVLKLVDFDIAGGDVDRKDRSRMRRVLLGLVSKCDEERSGRGR